MFTEIIKFKFYNYCSFTTLTYFLNVSVSKNQEVVVLYQEAYSSMTSSVVDVKRFHIITVTSILWSCATDWLATGVPLISLISSPTCRVACLWIIPPCIIRATMHRPSSANLRVMPWIQKWNLLLLLSTTTY